MRNGCWLNIAAFMSHALRKAKRWGFVGRQIGPGKLSKAAQGSQIGHGGQSHQIELASNHIQPAMAPSSEQDSQIEPTGDCGLQINKLVGQLGA